MARPKKIFTDKEIEQIKTLAAAQVPDDEIAAFLGCGETTVKRRFGPLLKEGRKAGIASLRAWQFQQAKKGNAALLIWLGKQLLGQREPRQDIQLTKVEPYVVEIDGESTKTVLGVVVSDQAVAREVN